MSEMTEASVRADVRAWLADVEQEWAWDHAHAAALHALNESEPVAAGVAWTCPLHWLQRYHDDDGRHQARSPSSQRNAARFAALVEAIPTAQPALSKPAHFAISGRR
jgi:hypothetical protein